jgi:hypothetical protein
MGCANLRLTVKGFAMAVFIQYKFSKPLLQNQCYTMFLFFAIAETQIKNL